MKIGPITICNWGWWVFVWRSDKRFGLFTNKEGVMPGRWGFFIVGFEFGSRNSGDRFGTWLKHVGLWPW